MLDNLESDTQALDTQALDNLELGTLELGTLVLDNLESDTQALDIPVLDTQALDIPVQENLPDIQARVPVSAQDRVPRDKVGTADRADTVGKVDTVDMDSRRQVQDFPDRGDSAGWAYRADSEDTVGFAAYLYLISY